MCRKPTHRMLRPLGWSIASLAIAGLVSVPQTSAQQAAKTPVRVQSNSDDAVEKLDGLMRRMAAYLRGLPAFDVTVRQSWKLTGSEARDGSNSLRLRVNHDGPFRLDVPADPEAAATLTCVGREGQITRVFRDSTHQLIAGDAGTIDDLVDDQLTASSLAGSGLDVVCRTRMDSIVMCAVSDVQDLGEVTLPQGQAHHFRCAWEGEPDVQLWISTGDAPVLLRKTQQLELDDDDRRLLITSDFVWKRADPWPASTFDIDISEPFVRVADLYSALVEGGTRDLIGNALPSVRLSDVKGVRHDLREHADRVICLFFWTTWATASTVQKREVLSLLEDFEDDGVVFYAVNVGEPKETVADFLKRSDYPGVVLLDEAKQLTQALRITSLPVCVLIGRDGRIAGVHLGNTEQDRELLRRELAAIAAGQRPSDSG